MSDDGGAPDFSFSAAANEFGDASRNALVATASLLFPPSSKPAGSMALEATTSVLVSLWIARSRGARDSRNERSPRGVFLRPSLWLVYFTSLFSSGG